MRNFRKYDFWLDSKNLAKEVYIILQKFPIEEKFALCDQLRRSVVSISSNITEGAARESEFDFARFLDIAGSACEVETQIEIAFDLGYMSQEQKDLVIGQLQSIERRLVAFKDKLLEKKKKSMS
ncbi:MAG: four helix bundle protein [Bacteroidales bacterium]|nr:four helix bundle protein [Bacteroidales bacterium]